MWDFTDCTKSNNKQKAEEKIDEHGFRTSKLRRWSLALLSILVRICVHGHCENSAKVLHSYQKCWFAWPLSSLLCVLTQRSRVSPLTSEMSDPPLRTAYFSAPDWPLWGLTHNWLVVFILLFWSCRFSWVQLLVWSSCQSWLRKVFWTLWHCFKDAGDKIPHLATHPRTHRDPHIHIHIYRYIHTHIHAHYRATMLPYFLFWLNWYF